MRGAMRRAEQAGRGSVRVTSAKRPPAGCITEMQTLTKKRSTIPLAQSSAAAPLPDPSANEKAAIDEAKRRVRERHTRVTVAIKQTEGAKVEIEGGGHSDHTGWLARLQDAFGTRGTHFAISQLNQLMTACQDTQGKVDGTRLNAMLAIIEGVQPQNELQAALAVQMAMTHSAATVLLNRAMRVDQIPQFDSAGSMAVKFARVFAVQAETLAKLQRGGEQVVKIVHVHPGAQAVVGNVVHAPQTAAQREGDSPTNGPRSAASSNFYGGTSGATGAGGGGNLENRNQPHAKGELPAPAAQPMPPLWSQDAEREPVPLASGRR